MLKLFVRFQARCSRQDGQALSEYGLVIALVAVAAIAGLIAFRTEILNVLNDITEGLKSR